MPYNFNESQLKKLQAQISIKWTYCLEVSVNENHIHDDSDL